MTPLATYRRISHLSVCAGFALGLLCAGAILGQTAVAQATSDKSQSQSTEKDRVAFSGALPHLDGDHAKVTIVEVTYGPGASSPPHSHPCPVIGYVISGAYRTQVKGEREEIYKAGETFYEAPNGLHQVSANTSTTRPVKFLAFFLCDHDTELSIAPLDAGGK